MADSIASADGTAIALWRSGSGPPLVALHGVTIEHTLHALAGQGHLATHTAPELLAAEVLAFLEG